MSNQSPQAQVNSGYSSVKHPRYVWLVRVFGLVLTLSLMNIDISDIENHVPNRHAKWADVWIAENDLENDFKDVSTSNQKLFAVSNATEQTEITNNQINQIASVLEPKKTNNQPSLVQNKSNTNRSILESREQLAYYSINSAKNSLLIEEPVAVLPVFEIDYQRNLQENYERMAKLDNGNSHKKNQQWLASGAIGPQMTTASVLEPNAQTYSEQSNIEALTAYQQGVGVNDISQAFSAMLNVGVSLGSHFELLSGMSYSKVDGTHSSYFNAEVEKHQTILTSVATTDNEGVISYTREEQDITYKNYFSDTLSASYQLSSIEIPLVLKYNFGKNKLNYFISSGVSTTIGTSYSANYTAVEIGEGNISDTKNGMNAVNLLVGVGLQYKATKHLMLKLSPGYRYGIPVSDAAYYRSNASSLGLFTGFNYYF